MPFVTSSFLFLVTKDAKHSAALVVFPLLGIHNTSATAWHQCGGDLGNLRKHVKGREVKWYYKYGIANEGLKVLKKKDFAHSESTCHPIWTHRFHPKKAPNWFSSGRPQPSNNGSSATGHQRRALRLRSNSTPNVDTPVSSLAVDTPHRSLATSNGM